MKKITMDSADGFNNIEEPKIASNMEINEREVADGLKKLKNGKAPSVTNITNKLPI